MEEQLSGACTVEIAAFDQFTSLLADAATSVRFDHVIFDTAPTGHTLRLLKLPAAWTGFVDANTTGSSCLGPLAGLQAKVEVYRTSLTALADGEVTTILLVARPDRAALAEAARTSRELSDLGIRNQQLIVNGVFTAHDRDDPLASALDARGREALREMPAALADLARTDVPLFPFAPVGVDGLRRLLSRDVTPVPAIRDTEETVERLVPLTSLIDRIETTGRGVIMTMGKGGVGKTTTAASIAVELASRGHEVLLSTTDPAAHVANSIGATVPHLRVTRIDPVAETQAYSEEVIAAAGPELDARARDLLEEDLRSPCTEEIAVFRAFARTVAQGEDGFVVLDTAPTGHTLLLLDAAEAYHREVARTERGVPEPVRQLLPRLRDPEFTRVLVVTLPEATPVHEAAELQADLRRAGIEPFAWVVNQSFTGAPSSDPVLRERGIREQPYIKEISTQLAQRIAWVPWLTEAPIGPAQLRRFARGQSTAALV